MTDSYNDVKYVCRNRLENQEMAGFPAEANSRVLKGEGTDCITHIFLWTSVPMAYFVIKSEMSSNRPKFGTLLWTSFFTPLERPTGTALMA